MSRFTDRLWRELVREYGAALAQTKREPWRRVARPRILAGTGAGLVAAGTAAALVLGTAGTAPAFAVTPNHDGSVTLTITRMDGIRGANARLRQLGYRARLVQVAAGCAARAARDRGETWTTTVHPALARAAANVTIHARFDPREIPVQRTLVIAAWAHRRGISIAPAHLVRGAAPDCLPAPPPPAVFSRRAGPVTIECVAGTPAPGGNSGSPPPSMGPGVRYIIAPPVNGGNFGNSSAGRARNQVVLARVCPAWAALADARRASEARRARYPNAAKH